MTASVNVLASIMDRNVGVSELSHYGLVTFFKVSTISNSWSMIESQGTNFIIECFLSFFFLLITYSMQALNAQSRALLMQKLDRSGIATRCV